MRISYRKKEIINKPLIINKTSRIQKEIKYLKKEDQVSEAIEAKSHGVQSYGTPGRLSKEERRVDALALRAEEGRDKLRKAAGRSKYPTIHRYPNEGTHLRKRTQVSAYE